MSLSKVRLAGRSWAANKRMLGIIGAIVAAISLAAVSWFAYSALRSDISFEDIRWVPFIGSIVIQLVTLLSLPVLWGRLLGFFWEIDTNKLDSTSKLALYKAYSRSWLARYIPGRVWALGGRLVFAAKCGIPAGPVTRSMGFEAVFIYGVLTLMGTSLILGVKVHFLVGGLVLVIGLVAFTCCIPLIQSITALIILSRRSNPLLRRVSGFVHRMLIGDRPLSFKHTLWGIGAYGTYSCLQLAFIVLVAQSLTDLTLVQAVTIAGAWGLGTALGYFAFIAPGPGGLGIRDGITLVLFAQVIDIQTAALVVAVSRIVMIGADIAFVGLIELLAMGQRIAQKVGSVSIGVEPG